MKIIIVGCGKIGTTIISSLLREGHDIVAVDSDPAVIANISDVYDVMCVCGTGTDYDTLAEAGVQDANMLIAVTGSDEFNMLSCFFAKKMGAEYTVARIRNPEFNDKNLGFMKQQLGISLTINPELLVAKEFFNILQLPSAVNIETFSRRNFEMAEIILRDNSPINGLSLIELRKKYKANYLVCLVKRGEEVYIPDGNFVLQSGDHIGIAATFTELQRLLEMIGVTSKKARNVIVLGASTTAYYLSKMLLAAGNDVTIIDKDKARCERFSEILPGAVIINGDGTQPNVLLEEGLLSSDAIATLTGFDEENIIVSFFAISQNVPKVITKANRNELIGMAEKIGLDSIISPKKTISDVIVRYARALQNSLGSNVETLYKLMGDRAEALEFNVQPDFKALHIAIKDMKLKKDILIAGIIRRRKAFVPTGDDEILAGDKVIVISKSTDTMMNDLSDILR